MPAYMHVCMLMLSVLAMTHLTVSLNSVGKKHSSPDAAPQLGTPHWGTRRNPLLCEACHY